MLIEVGPPDRWTVELVDGPIVAVWAGGYGREGDYYTLGNLAVLEEGEQLPEDAVLTGRNPTSPSQILLAVARFRKNFVIWNEGDDEWPKIYSGPAVRRDLLARTWMFFRRLWRQHPELSDWLHRDERPLSLDDYRYPSVRVPNGPPPGWSVELANRRTVDVWAEQFTRKDGYYLFTNPVELEWDGEFPDGAFEDVLLLGELSQSPCSVELAVARFPEGQVRSVKRSTRG